MKENQTFPFVLLVLCAGYLLQCTSAETVAQESLRYLESRYLESFKVESLDMQRNEGNWGMARLELTPEKKPRLKFQLNYSYSNDQVIYENYLLKTWEALLLEKIESRFRELAGMPLKLHLSRKNSLSANSMKFPVDRSLEGMTSLVNPTLSLEFAEVEGPATPDYQQLSGLISYLESLGLEKVSLRLEYGKKGKNGKLMVQWYRPHSTPGPAVLKSLFQPAGESSLGSKTSADFEKAMELLKEGREDLALAMFQRIVSSYDSPYRYNPYVIAQSGNVYEAAFEAGKILHSKGKKKQAMFYFDLLKDRLSYEEVPLRYSAYLKYIENLDQ